MTDSPKAVQPGSLVGPAADAAAPLSRQQRRRKRWARKTRALAAFIGAFADTLEAEGTASAFGQACRNMGKAWAGSATRRARRIQAKLDARVFAVRTFISARLSLPPRPAVRFIGYVEGSLGLGESLRSGIRAFSRLGRPFAIYPFGVGIETRRIGSFLPEHYDYFGRYRVNMLEMSADQLPALRANISPHLLLGGRTVLRPYWELPRAPAAWAPLLDGIDEIWAPNGYIRDAFAHIFPGPIHIVRPCVEVPEGPFFDRAHLGLRDGLFYFMFSFDYYSSPARKNPLAVLRAFQAAFPDMAEAVHLVIKTNGDCNAYPEARDALLAAAAADQRLQIIHGTLSRLEMASLIRACDCYVSLHRAEGFGLGMAEAMFFGRRVVGTDFSGSTDFLSAETGFPVAYDLVPVQAGDYPWSEEQVWAEPRHDSAVVALRAAFYETEAATAKSAAAQTLIRTAFGPDAAGQAIARRVASLLDAPPA